MPRGVMPSADELAAQSPAPRPSLGVVGYTPTRGASGESLQLAARDVQRAGDVIAETNRMQDQMVAEAAFNRLQERRMQLEFDEKEGFTSQRQGNAVGRKFLDNYMGSFEQSAAGIADGLENDQQRRMFNERAQIAGLQFRGALLQHQSRETEAFNDATERNSVEVTLRGMAQHPEDEDAFQAGLARINATVQDAGIRKGLPSEMIAVNKGRALDAAYTARILSTLNGVPGVSEANPGAAEQMFIAVRDQLGPDTQITLAKHVEGGVQKELFDNAFVLVKQSAGDLNAIKVARAALDTDQFKRLDERQRVTLEATLDNYETRLIQQQEAAAARAQREQELRLHRADAAFDTAQKLIDQGIPLDPNDYARLAQLTNGTPRAEGLMLLQQHARLVGGTAALPLEQQRQGLDRVLSDIAQNGTSEARVQRRDALQKILDGALSDLKEDQLGAALKRGPVTKIEPIDVTSVDGLLSTIRNRMDAVEHAQAWARGYANVSPLRAYEVGPVSELLQNLPPKQRSSAIATLAAQIGPQASAGLAAQMAPTKADAKPEDKALSLAFALAADQTTAGRYTSEILLTGQQALKDKAVKVENGADYGWRAEIAKEVDGLFPSQSMANSAKEAAYLIRAGLAFEGGGSARQAVKLAVGGDVIERNGRKIVLPPQVDEDAFDQRIKAIKATDIVRQNIGATPRMPGMLEPGNIDLASRPVATNADGSISTVRSLGVNVDGKEVLIPTVSDDGRVMTDQQAIESYRRTGKHLGKFATPEASTAYAQMLHKQQEEAYFVRSGGKRIPIDQFISKLPDAQLVVVGKGKYIVMGGTTPVTNSRGKAIVVEVGSGTR